MACVRVLQYMYHWSSSCSTMHGICLLARSHKYVASSAVLVNLLVEWMQMAICRIDNVASRSRYVNVTVIG